MRELLVFRKRALKLKELNAHMSLIAEMNNQKITLIHYGELSLKGRNRSFFENKLKENIERETGGKVTKYRGRFVLENGDPDFLKNIFGN